MIVEDEAIVAMDLAAQLQKMGYKVCGPVNNSRDALACAMEQKPDLILMDIVIKGMPDGIDTVGLIHRTTPVPVIYLTAYSDLKTIGRAALTAPYGYLTKPFQSHELRAAIEVARHKAMLERQLRESEQRLAQLAHYDPLTGLANRAFLSEEIERQIVRARRHQERMAVVFLDLDHFKQINDSLGHATGDQLLQWVAAKLKAAVRESDTVARLGGDEFVLLLPEINTPAEVLIVTNKVQIECAQPLQLAGHEIGIGISLGVSLFPDDAMDSSTLLQYADSALYHAKSEGRNNLQFYRPELTAHMEQRMRLGAGLRVAVANGELELYYQPIISMTDHKPHAAEALIRWNHPSLGLLMPDTFIPIVEDIGLSVSIGEWVIVNACQEAASWPANAENGGGLTVAVNVSARQFKCGTLVQIVNRALAQSGLAANRLCIEITEQLLLQDTDANLVTIAQLKALGVKIAIDDFGVGYSSLAAIRRLGPTELKLDCSLTRNVAFNPDDAAIARAVIAMAHTLKLTVVAEGVENLAQEAFFDDEGCDMTQGFHYYRPQTAIAFRQWLRRGGTV